MSESFKIKIPADVEKKIRHLCSKISEVEWSGTLFYTVEGNIEDKSLIIVCKDIYVMDIGSAGYTEFDVNPGVVSYMCDHPELLDYQMGLIHSHNKMATWFSGTDTRTLREEGNKRNHFVSLIVNNAGTYTAAITKKVESKRTIVEEYSYNSFDNAPVQNTKEYTSESTEIRYHYLTVIKEEVYNPFQEIDTRLDEIRKEKSSKNLVDKTDLGFSKDKTILNNFNTHYPNDNIGLNYQGTDKKIANSRSLFDDVDYSNGIEDFEKKDGYTTVDIDDKTLHSYLLQLITGAVAIADESRIDPNKWASTMEKVFDKRFHKNMKVYRAYIEYMCEFVCMYPTGDYIACNEDDYAYSISCALYKELDKLPKNKYIEAIKETLLIWM